MRILVACVLVAATATAAQSHWRHSSWRYPPPPLSLYASPGARIIAVPEAREASERTKRWEEFCQPVLLAPDKLGISRYSYAHDDCDIGRIE